MATRLYQCKEFNQNMSPSKFAFGPLHCSTHTLAQLLAEIRLMLSDPAEQPRIINCVNAHIFNLAWRDKELVQSLNQSRIVAADGMSIVWAARLLGAPVLERCNMTEAFRAFMNDSTFPSVRAILVGGTEEIAAQAGARIARKCSHVTIVDTLSGYLIEEEYITYFRQCRPIDFVFLGLGTPKTERIATLLAKIRPEAIIWHVGGGSILFLSGHLQEAPEWMRQTGLQWFHRFALEPRRMWKRYLVGNTLFIMRFLYWLVWHRKALGRKNVPLGR